MGTCLESLIKTRKHFCRIGVCKYLKIPYGKNAMRFNAQYVSFRKLGAVTIEPQTHFFKPPIYLPFFQWLSQRLTTLYNSSEFVYILLPNFLSSAKVLLRSLWRAIMPFSCPRVADWLWLQPCISLKLSSILLLLSQNNVTPHNWVVPTIADCFLLNVLD